MYIASRLNVRGISRALARLCIYAVWSRPLLVAYSTLLENSCHASFMIVAIPIVAEVVKKIMVISVKFTEVKIFIWIMSPLWSKKTSVTATD